VQVARNRRYLAMQEIAGRINEDLRNQLGSIELCASMLHRDLRDDPDSGPLAGRIVDSVRGMDIQLRNYLTCAGMPPPNRTEIPVKQWLKETLIHWRGQDGLNRYRFRLETELQQQRLIADRQMLDLLLQNAVENAMESMPAGGTITLACHLDADGGSFEISVRDHGQGIDGADMERVFDPCYSTRNNRNGMGLPIIHFIVAAHGGMVRLESEPGRGTTLRILLPAR